MPRPHDELERRLAAIDTRLRELAQDAERLRRLRRKLVDQLWKRTATKIEAES